MRFAEEDIKSDDAWKALVAEASALFERHGEELTYWKEDKGPVAPVWPQYEALRSQQRLHVVSARDDAGGLVGYFVFYVAPMSHYAGVTCAIEDTFWLAPEARKTPTAGVRFLKAAVAAMAASGARFGVVSEKYKAPNGRLWESLGFLPEEIRYSCQFGDV